MRCLFFFLAVALVIASAAPASAGAKLEGNEIKAKYSGARVYARSPSGRVVMHDYNPDGTIVGIVGTRDKPKDLDEGRWWVKADTLCREWKQWSQQKPEACFTIEHAGKTAIWYRSDGSVYRKWDFASAANDGVVQPLCHEVGGYVAYMKKTGKICRLR